MAAAAEEKSGESLKAWLKKEVIYDNDIFSILVSQGINDPETDFKTYTQKQWDELWRRAVVERAKELKDQKAKVNMEKKMKKLEKFWRKESGVKLTSIKDKGADKPKKPIENSAQAQADALKKGVELKKFLQKSDCFSPDLIMVLVQYEICSEEDIPKIDSNDMFDEIYRQIRVIRAQELKDQAAKVRMEKLMTKFEKIWRGKTGIKKTSIKSSNAGGKAKKDPKTAANEAMQSDGATLKKWMRKNDVWEMALYDELMSNGIDNPDKLTEIDEKGFDEIVRKVRVDRFSQLKDQSARNRADKLLVKFEKIWRKTSGNKKTSIKK